MNLKNIFSIENEYSDNKKHKVINFCGINIKFKQKYNNKKLLPLTRLYNNYLSPEGYKYKGNEEELGLGNIEIKLERVKNGGAFEWEDMIVANKAIGSHFLNNKKTVVNIGSGVGTFEYYNAPICPQVHFLASEMEKASTKWAIENRNMQNVTYCDYSIKEILEKYPQKFDLAISIDVIEHIKDYKAFLDAFVQLSDYAIIATPNRDRYSDKDSLIKPPYIYHTQEFNAGELYFILKMYYKDVKLYSLPDPLKPKIVEVGIYSSYEKLIAVCKN